MKLLWITLMGVVVMWANTIMLPEHFKAAFVQTITNPKQKVIHYRGSVVYSENNLFKWSYVEPTKKEVCTNGKEILVVDHDLEQISVYQIDKGFDLIQILKSARLYKKYIYVTQYEGKNYTIKLNNKGQLQSVLYYDDLDNKVQILFTKIKYGKGKLPALVIRCSYSADYDIIKG
ncbi:MAG: LolA-like outer membrane lipoprotein chaperone [Sulfurovum sp.]|nr:LolA-like outer membrane lipoprotein chaperone [Sulfurovum sp.]